MKNKIKLFYAILVITGFILSTCSWMDDLESDDNYNSSEDKITITPSTVTLARGDTQQFNASESWVTWSLEGSAGSSSINSSGLLTVGVDESASALTVMASRSYYTSGTAMVTIVSPSQTPSGLKIVRPGPESIQLSWSAMSGVSQYTVQRSTNGTTFGTISTALGTSYTDTAVADGTSYYYRIQANGVNSPVVYTFAQDYFRMPTLSQRKLIPLDNAKKHYYRFAVNAGTEYTIEWQNGNNQNITVQSFKVTAYQNNGTQIFHRDSWYSGQRDGYSNPAVFTATNSGFVTVLVANDSGSSQNYQIYCYGSSEIVDSGTVALPPYKVNAFWVSSPNPSSIILTWDSVSDGVKYNIYRANTQTGTPGKIGESNGTSYTDYQVADGASYWYTIAAVNAEEREGCRFQGAFGYAALHYTLSYYSSTQILSLATGGKHYYRLAVTKDDSYTIEWQNGNNQNITVQSFKVTAYQNNGTQIFHRDSWYSGQRDGYTNPAVFIADATGFVTILVANDSGSAQNYQIYYY